MQRMRKKEKNYTENWAKKASEGDVCAQITMNAVYAVVLFNRWHLYEGSSNISSRAAHTTYYYMRIDLCLMMIPLVIKMVIQNMKPTSNVKKEHNQDK